MAEEEEVVVEEELEWMMGSFIDILDKDNTKACCVSKSFIFKHVTNNVHTSEQMHGMFMIRLLICSAANVDSNNGRNSMDKSCIGKQLMIMGRISLNTGRNAYSLRIPLIRVVSSSVSSLVSRL